METLTCPECTADRGEDASARRGAPRTHYRCPSCAVEWSEASRWRNTVDRILSSAPRLIPHPQTVNQAALGLIVAWVSLTTGLTWPVVVLAACLAYDVIHDRLHPEPQPAGEGDR